MAESRTGLKWGVERRLEFIEFRLFWEGGVNRSDIINTFDVSVPQASKDLTLYQERAPQNAIYDKSAKRYIASKHFKPHFLKPDPDSYLSRLRSVAEGLTELSESWIAQLPETDIALTPVAILTPLFSEACWGLFAKRARSTFTTVDEQGAAGAGMATDIASRLRL